MPIGRPRLWLRGALAGCVLALAFPALAQAAVPGALTQYSYGSDDWATTGAVPTTYALDSTLGFLAPDPTPGTVALYGCASGPDHFLSLDSTCEGQTVLDTEGYIYAAAPATVASSPVYSCLTGSTSTEDHFVSTSSTCGGALLLGLLGYVLDSAPLNRYSNNSTEWVTTGSAPRGYSLVVSLGYLLGAGPDTTPIYGCKQNQNTDQFLSKDRGCEGMTLLGLEGWIYDVPPANVATVAVYRCSVTGSFHFASNDPNCEGHNTDGLMGYALEQPIPLPAPTSTTPPVTTVPQPVAPTGSHARLLGVKLKFYWHWVRSTTRLRKVLIHRMPAAATIHITCRGKGSGCRARAVSAKRRGLRRLIHTLTGRVYRPRDRILVSVTARGFQPLRAQITIRFNKIPIVGLK